MQKSDDVNANIYCTYFEGGIGKELNKDYFYIKANTFGAKAFLN